MDLLKAARIGVLSAALAGAIAFTADYYRTRYLSEREEPRAEAIAMHEFYACSVERSIETIIGTMSIPERVEYFVETRNGYCTKQKDLENTIGPIDG